VSGAGRALADRQGSGSEPIRPVDQARDATYAFRNYVQADPRSPGPRPRAGEHAPLGTVRAGRSAAGATWRVTFKESLDKERPRRGTVRLVVLYTSGVEVDWPDHIDSTTGDFTYYGDNRTPGHDLHDTRRGGNLLLRDIFAASRSTFEARRTVPPILLFQSSGTGRDVIFRGLLAPGSPRLASDEELVAIWRTTKEMRFQNYRSHFTVLRTPVVPRAWIRQILAGDPLGSACPGEWRKWVQGRIYQALEAPRNLSVRSKAEQLAKPEDAWMMRMVHDHFSSMPIAFESFAAEMWVHSEPHVASIEVTRPSRDGGRDAVGEYRLGPSQDPVRLQFAL
jgi:AspBHI-like restriction endonuclease